MFPYKQDNIVALATPPGIGALAIVRLSGTNLKELYQSFTHKSPKNRFAAFTGLYHPVNNNLLDEAVVTYFMAPKSFTGEDMIEISCHGGNNVQNNILRAAIESGVRLAEPGEFSFRSYMNGKMDLLQAEAVSSLITSKSTLSTEISLNHLKGKVSATLQKIKSDILDVLSLIENELNFSEEEIELTSLEKIKHDVICVRSKIQSILESSTFGKNIFSGIRVILLGKPNSGKSSLFNAILGYERTIVSSTPGTTRDTIEAWFELGGIPICLIDTAGVWESKEYLDSLGVEKTMDELKRADICIIVDETNPEKLLRKNFKKHIKDHYVLVKSKIDLDSSSPSKSDNIISTSVKKDKGLNKLLTSLSTYSQLIIGGKGSRLDQVLVTKRQRQLLENSMFFLNESINQLDAGVETDIIASTLRSFVISISDVVGEIPNKDVMKNIFNSFCVGK